MEPMVPLCFNPAIGLPGLLTMREVVKEVVGKEFQSRNRASRPSDEEESRYPAVIEWFQSRNRASRPSDVKGAAFDAITQQFQSRNRASRPSDQTRLLLTHGYARSFNPAIGLPGLLTTSFLEHMVQVLSFQSRNRASRPSDQRLR